MSVMTRQGQIGTLGVLDLVSDLFTSSPKEGFSRDEVLILLNEVKNNPAIFDPSIVAEWDRNDDAALGEHGG